MLCWWRQTIKNVETHAFLTPCFRVCQLMKSSKILCFFLSFDTKILNLGYLMSVFFLVLLWLLFFFIVTDFEVDYDRVWWRLSNCIPGGNWFLAVGMVAYRMKLWLCVYLSRLWTALRRVIVLALCIGTHTHSHSPFLFALQRFMKLLSFCISRVALIELNQFCRRKSFNIYEKTSIFDGKYDGIKIKWIT